MHARGARHSTVDGGRGHGPRKSFSARPQLQLWSWSRCVALLAVIILTSALLYIIPLILAVIRTLGQTNSARTLQSCYNNKLQAAVLANGLRLKPPDGAHMLLGAHTSTCWTNAEHLDGAFPASSCAVQGRQVVGRLSAQDLCTLPDMQRPEDSSLVDAEKMISHARAIMQCGSTEQSGCSAAQLYVLRHVMHAAAHGTARYYLAPGSIPQAQLEQSIAMNPAVCTAAASSNDSASSQIRVPFLQAACQRLPGMLQLMGTIASHGDTMDARWDPTLPDLPGKYNHPLPDAALTSHLTAGDLPSKAQRTTHNAEAEARTMAPGTSIAAAAQSIAQSSQNYMVGFNLYNSEQLMPHFIIHVLALVTYLPPGHVLVSCYESGSTDSTPEWLRLLQTLLDLLHIPNHIQFGGNVTRALIPERIPFLAKVRNQVLLPLQDPAAYAAALSRVHHPLAAIAEQHGLVYPAHKLIFLNDAFFSWQDIIRMMHHDADMVCGMDFYLPNPPKARQFWRSSLFRPKSWPFSRLKQQTAHETSTELLQNAGQSALMHDRGVQAGSIKLFNHGHDDFQAAGRRRSLLWLDGGAGFYDIWVARDITGRRFENEWPIIQDFQTQELLKQGMPFPVQCCWNAATVVNATMYLSPTGLDAQHSALANLPVNGQLWLHILDTRGPVPVGEPVGLKFRAPGEGECRASECSLMCNDLWGLKYKRILVDPSVRLTYKPYSLDFTQKHKMDRLPTLTWWQMHNRMMMENQSMWQMVKQPEAITCCHDGEFDACFMDDKWLATAPPQPQPPGDQVSHAKSQ